jgi:hypothetical protein
MPTSSKRAGSQQRQQQQQQQSIPEDDGYDEYLSYQYYPKPAPGGGYEYVQEQQKPQEYDQASEQYYDERVPNNAAPMQRK